MCSSYRGISFVDAHTVDATARFTNIQFTADLHDTSTHAYKDLTKSIIEEVRALKGSSSGTIWSLTEFSILQLFYH